MEIRYLGHSCFQLKGKDATVICDPFDDKMVGIKLPSLSADIVTISHGHPDHNAVAHVSGDPLVIDIPGEFEQKAVRVTGFSVFHDKVNGQERGKNTIYKIELEDVSILHLGDLGHELSDEILEEIGEVKVLLIPVGGFFTIGPDDAARVVKQLEPSLVIPMHYNSPQLNQETFSKLAPVEEFLMKLGVTVEERLKKVTVKKEDLLEDMKVVVMDIS